MSYNTIQNKTLQKLIELFRSPIPESAIVDRLRFAYIKLGFDSPFELIASLLKNKSIYKFYITDPKGKKKPFYCSNPDISLYEIVNSLWEKKYFCNLTSIYYHGLTNQIPRVVYIAREGTGRQSDIKRKKVVLSDVQIFQAFIKPSRYNTNIYKLDKGDIVVTERVDSERIGIIKTDKNSKLFSAGSSVASLERALIDACVNPQYNGGIVSVVDYYRIANNKIDINLFLDVYKQLDFVYPYWQAIGFICDKIGMVKLANSIYKSFKIKNVFYLDRMAKLDWELNEKWQLKHPRII